MYFSVNPNKTADLTRDREDKGMQVIVTAQNVCLRKEITRSEIRWKLTTQIRGQNFQSSSIRKYSIKFQLETGKNVLLTIKKRISINHKCAKATIIKL